MATVFISYSTCDSSFTQRLAEDLSNLGHKVWRDSTSIMVGKNIPREIGDAIIKCDYVIPIISRNSIQSNWVERELRLRLWQEIPKGIENILPALIDNCELPIFLQDIKYADFRKQYTYGLSQLQKRFLSQGNLNEPISAENWFLITIFEDIDSDEIADAMIQAILAGSNLIKIKYDYHVEDIVVPSLVILRDAIIRSKQLLPENKRLAITIFVSDVRQEYVKSFFADRPLPKGFVLYGR